MSSILFVSAAVWTVLVGAREDCSGFDDSSAAFALCSIFANCDMSGFSFWAQSADACAWNDGEGLGVSCDEGGDVTGLTLSSQNLNCALDTSVDWPDTMETIDLQGLNLRQELDFEWFVPATALSTLNLKNNALSGELNMTIFTNESVIVEEGGYLDVSQNRFSNLAIRGWGTVVADSMGGYLSGALPDIFNFRGTFSAENNGFQDMFNPSKLRWPGGSYDLSNNQLYGTVSSPQSWQKPVKMDLRRNNIQGPIDFYNWFSGSNTTLIELSFDEDVYCTQWCYCPSSLCAPANRTRETCRTLRTCEATCQCGTCYSWNLWVYVDFDSDDTTQLSFDKASRVLPTIVADLLYNRGLSKGDFEAYTTDVEYGSWPSLYVTIGCVSEDVLDKVYHKLKNIKMDKKLQHKLDDDYDIDVDIDDTCLYNLNDGRTTCDWDWNWNWHWHLGRALRTAVIVGSVALCLVGSCVTFVVYRCHKRYKDRYTRI